MCKILFDDIIKIYLRNIFVDTRFFFDETTILLLKAGALQTCKTMININKHKKAVRRMCSILLTSGPRELWHTLQNGILKNIRKSIIVMYACWPPSDVAKIVIDSKTAKIVILARKRYFCVSGKHSNRCVFTLIAFLL